MHRHRSSVIDLAPAALVGALGLLGAGILLGSSGAPARPAARGAPVSVENYTLPEQVDQVGTWHNVDGDPWAQESVDFSLLKGRPVLVEFWATWCPPCRTTVPHLNELARDHPNLQVISLTNVDGRQSAAQVESFVAQNIEYPVGVLNGPATLQRYGVRGIPYAVLYGPDGTVLYQGHPMNPGLETALEGL